MNQVQWLRIALLLLLALGLAIPAVAQVRSPVLSDSQEPGSVIIFPKFITGTTTAPDGSTVPRSEFEVGVVCPKNLDGTPGTCAEGTRVKIRFHWVCPGSQDPATKFICRETDFDLVTTVFGKLIFNAANVGAGSFPTLPTSAPTVGVARVPLPPCERGYLIGWVVDPSSDQAIKFDGLIGDGILREADGGISAYNAIPVQASPLTPRGAVVGGGSGPGELLFDGTVPGNYQSLPGSIKGDVRFDVPLPTPAPTTPFTTVRTDLTLLTVDVDSNAPNLPTVVPLDIYNANEFLVSTFVEFICWTEVSLTALDPNLTATGMMTTKGLVVGDSAEKFPFNGITSDEPGPVTLLGIVTTVLQTVFPGPPVTTTSQAYSYSLFNDSNPVPTEFEYRPSGAPGD
jgi:hypothetical protein